MILTGLKIIEEVNKWDIIISDFNVNRITTNSYDLSLSNSFIQYKGDIIDPKKDNEYTTIVLEEGQWIKMNPGDFLLGSSIEKIWSTKYVPIIHNKSSIARMGLFIHITADLIDIWSIWTTTFQLYATLPIVLYPGMLIGQVSFWNTDWEIILYEGKYQNSSGPLSSKMFLDSFPD